MTAPKRRKVRKITPEPTPPIGTELQPLTAAAPATLDDAIVEKMSEQHPIYGAFGHAFREIGGVERLADWAEDEPGKFYAIFSKMIPRDASQNQINIQINAKLAPGPLDE